jgi:hypothetical protein
VLIGSSIAVFGTILFTLMGHLAGTPWPATVFRGLIMLVFILAVGVCAWWAAEANLLRDHKKGMLGECVIKSSKTPPGATFRVYPSGHQTSQTAAYPEGPGPSLPDLDATDPEQTEFVWSPPSGDRPEAAPPWPSDLSVEVQAPDQPKES